MRLCTVVESKLKFKSVFSGLCFSGKAMAAYTKPQQWKKEESERLRGEGDHVELIDRRFEKMASCRFQERKKRARQSMNRTFLG